MAGSPASKIGLGPTTGYKALSLLARKLPSAISRNVVESGAAGVSILAGDRRLIVERNLQRVRGTELRSKELNRQVARTFSFYARYYNESFRLPELDERAIDDGFDYSGFEHIQRAHESGRGVILALPHLGGWEWAAFWLTKVHGYRVTAVVEPIEPPEAFEWFASFRESLGMEVIAVGPNAGPKILSSLEAGHIVCLLCDRVVPGASGVPVDFFGEQTVIPAGPATLALRTGAAVIPTAVYFRNDRHFAECRPPLDLDRHGRFREDVSRVTQDLARELERFIRAAPEQWHTLQPNWPSDFRALGRPVPEIYSDL